MTAEGLGCRTPGTRRLASRYLGHHAADSGVESCFYGDVCVRLWTEEGSLWFRRWLWRERGIWPPRGRVDGAGPGQGVVWASGRQVAASRRGALGFTDYLL